MAAKGMDKYQEWALKSGFPFENEILQVVNKLMPTSKVVRNIEFQTINEERKPTIRSLDFSVSISKDLRNIPARAWNRGPNEVGEVNFIIDCKYTSDDGGFLFTPSTRPILRTERNWPHLVPMLVKNEIGEDIKVYRHDLISLARIDECLPIGGTGRKVSEQTRERDSIASAMIQMFQGLHEVVEKKARTLGTTPQAGGHYGRNAYFFFPIIVTNAPLLLLREQITPADVKAATDKNNFMNEVDMLLAEMPDIFDVKQSWEELKRILSSSRNPKLGWSEKGLTDGTILFCNSVGLENFIKGFISNFDKLPLESVS